MVMGVLALRIQILMKSTLLVAGIESGGALSFFFFSKTITIREGLSKALLKVVGLYTLKLILKF